jgi:hypothetical protein
MNNKLDLIIETLKSIEDRLSMIEQNIYNVTEKSKNVEEDCAKMRGHIDFIEKTYSLVRKPLSYLKTKIEYVMGTESYSLELPIISQQQKELL